MPRRSDPQKINAAKDLAKRGKSASEIAQQLGVQPNTVRDWAGKEIAAYKKGQERLVRRLALQGKEVSEIAKKAGVPERTVYLWARKELRTAVHQGRRKRWGSNKGQQPY